MSLHFSIRAMRNDNNVSPRMKTWFFIMIITLDIKDKAKIRYSQKPRKVYVRKKTFHSIEAICLGKICMKMDYVMAL